MFTASTKFSICLKIGCPTNFISVFLLMLLFSFGKNKTTTWRGNLRGVPFYLFFLSDTTVKIYLGFLVKNPPSQKVDSLLNHINPSSLTMVMYIWLSRWFVTFCINRPGYRFHKNRKSQTGDFYPFLWLDGTFQFFWQSVLIALFTTINKVFKQGGKAGKNNNYLKNSQHRDFVKSPNDYSPFFYLATGMKESYTVLLKPPPQGAAVY